MRPTVRLDLPVAVFLAMLWARVSDVGIAEYGLPSLAVPFAIGFMCVSIARRLWIGERLGVTTFRRLFPVLPYLAVVSLSVLWASAPDRALTTAIDLAKDLLIFWVLIELIDHLATLKACCLALTLVAGSLAAVSVYQQATGTFTSDYGGFAQASVRQIVGSVSLYRLSGPVGDPNYFALILLVVVPVGLATLRTPLHRVAQLMVIAALTLVVGAVLLTYSRGGALVLALGSVLSLARFRIRGPLMAVLVILLPFGIVLVPGPVWDRLNTLVNPLQGGRPVGQFVDDSVALRLGAQRVALEMFLEHPFFGIGAGNYPVLYQDYSRSLLVPAVATEFFPHNLYLQVAAESGVVGLLAFLPIIIGPLVTLELTRRRSGPVREWRELATGLEIGLLCYLVASLLLHASYPRYLWMLLALTVAARQIAPAPATPPRR
jgi:putative inorganic carbon (HCO3(-)) transporter